MLIRSVVMDRLAETTKERFENWERPVFENKGVALYTKNENDKNQSLL